LTLTSRNNAVKNQSTLPTFGMVMSGRSFTSDDYRYGFQRQEMDNELSHASISFEYRIEDSRLGRFISIDPLASKYSYNSPYAFSENCVISCIELEGLEKYYAANQWHPNIFIGQIGNNSEVRLVDRASLEQVVKLIVMAKVGDITGEDTYTEYYSNEANKLSVSGIAMTASFETMISEDTGVAAYELQGEIDGTYAGVKGKVAGFQANATNDTGTGAAPLAVVASTEAAAFKAEANARIGREYGTNLQVDATGKALTANADGTVGILTGEGDKYGAYVGGNVGAYGLEGDVNPSFTLFGFLKIGFTIGGSVGSAHAGGGVGAYYDQGSGTTKADLNVHFGVGAGVKLGLNLEAGGN